MRRRDVDVFLIPKLLGEVGNFYMNQLKLDQKQIANFPQKYTLILKESL